MTGGKKWMTVLREEHHEWLKDVIKQTDLRGTDIIGEMFERIMADDKKFIASLAQAQLKIKLQTINDKKAALAEEEKELKKQYSPEKVTA